METSRVVISEGFRFGALPANNPEKCNGYMLQGRTSGGLQYQTPNRMAEAYSLLRIERQMIPSGSFLCFIYMRGRKGEVGYISYHGQLIFLKYVQYLSIPRDGGIISSGHLSIYLIILHASDHAAETP